MKRKPKLSENSEFEAIDAALQRAAKAAHSLARKTNTPCYVCENGAIVNVTARKLKKTVGKTV